MSVADDVARPINLLRSGVVVGVSVYKIASVKIVDRDRHGERGVGSGNVLTVHGIYKLGGRHVRGRSNDTHRSGIARTRLDLLSIRDRHIGHRGAEVDEVVAGGERSDLTSRGCLLAILLEACGNNARIESYKEGKFNENSGS